MAHIERQKQAIADYLLLGLPLTGLEAINKFGCHKASTRIGELERSGRLPKGRSRMDVRKNTVL